MSHLPWLSVSGTGDGSKSVKIAPGAEEKRKTTQRDFVKAKSY